jgi:hypothetical protein
VSVAAGVSVATGVSVAAAVAVSVAAGVEVSTGVAVSVGVVAVEVSVAVGTVCAEAVPVCNAKLLSGRTTMKNSKRTLMYLNARCFKLLLDGSVLMLAPSPLSLPRVRCTRRSSC